MLVEAAHWDAVSMFRTGRRHKITSEAGKRNERGVDPTICEAAADRVVELLVEHGGGPAEPGVTVVGTPPAIAGRRGRPATSPPASPAWPIAEDRSVEACAPSAARSTGDGAAR